MGRNPYRAGIKRMRERSRDFKGVLLTGGSNAPIHDMLQTCGKKTFPEFTIFSAN